MLKCVYYRHTCPCRRSQLPRYLSTTPTDKPKWRVGGMRNILCKWTMLDWWCIRCCSSPYIQKWTLSLVLCWWGGGGEWVRWLDGGGVLGGCRVQLCNPSSVPVTSEQIWRSVYHNHYCNQQELLQEKMTIVIESAGHPPTAPGDTPLDTPLRSVSQWKAADSQMGPPGNLKGNYIIFREKRRPLFRHSV